MTESEEEERREEKWGGTVAMRGKVKEEECEEVEEKLSKIKHECGWRWKCELLT